MNDGMKADIAVDLLQGFFDTDFCSLQPTSLVIRTLLEGTEEQFASLYGDMCFFHSRVCGSVDGRSAYRIIHKQLKELHGVEGFYTRCQDE